MTTDEAQFEVSVILCSYNRAEHLEKTLRSLRRVEVPKDWPVELILVDNASTDQTPEVMRTFDHPQMEVRSVREEETFQFAAPGARLVVRKRARKESVPDTGLELKGPTGDSRGTLGEEFEVQWRLYQNGWEIWHNPEIHLDHKIPAERLEEDYLKDFFRAIGLSRHHTRMMRFAPWQHPFATVAYWGADLWKLARLAWTVPDNGLYGPLRAETGSNDSVHDNCSFSVQSVNRI